MEGSDENKNRSLYTIHVLKSITLKIDDKSLVEDDDHFNFQIDR